MVCSGCRDPRRQVIVRSRDPLANYNIDILRNLANMGFFNVLEVIHDRIPRIAFVHFSREEGVSTFFHQHSVGGIDVDGASFHYQRSRDKLRAPSPLTGFEFEPEDEDEDKQDVRDKIGRVIVGINENIAREEAITERQRRRLRFLQDARNI